MSNIESTITILTLNRKDRRATKKFRKQNDGSIEKLPFSAGIKYWLQNHLS